MSNWNLKKANSILGRGGILVDVRTKKEFDKSHLKGARRVNYPLGKQDRKTKDKRFLKKFLLKTSNSFLPRLTAENLTG